MTYSTAQAAKLSGASVRQLQYWDEQHLVIPLKGAGRRSYTEQQVRQLWYMVKLIGEGVPRRRAAKIAERFAQQETEGFVSFSKHNSPTLFQGKESA